MLSFGMLRRTTATAKPREKEIWAVFDEHDTAPGDSGRQLQTFSTQNQAELFRSRLTEVARLKHGCNPKFAFNPCVNVEPLIAIARQHPNLRLRTERLKEFIPSGQMVEPRHLAAPGPTTGYLRCH
jgi:hypothetical protein